MRTLWGLLSLLLMVALLGACQPIVAPDAGMDMPAGRSARGELLLADVPDWGGIGIYLDVDVQEVDAETHQATGHVNWRNFMPGMEEGVPDWKLVNAEARYALFGEDFANGDPGTVIIISQIVEKQGFGQGEPGQYAYFWFRAGGAGEEPAAWAMKYYSFDPFQEFFPDDAPPAVEFIPLDALASEDPALPIVADVGGLQIQ